jgi:hypothetical protein
VVLRGLSIDPDNRYSSMVELLADLARNPGRRIPRGLAAVAVGVTFLGAGVAWRVWDSPSLCPAAEDELVEVWNAGRAASIERAFLATGRPDARAAFNEVARAFERFTRGWMAMRDEVCAATRLRGLRSEEVLGLRRICLDVRANQMRALTERLLAADATMVEGAAHEVQAFADLAECADEQALVSARSQQACAGEPTPGDQPTTPLGAGRRPWGDSGPTAPALSMRQAQASGYAWGVLESALPGDRVWIDVSRNKRQWIQCGPFTVAPYQSRRHTSKGAISSRGNYTRACTDRRISGASNRQGDRLLVCTEWVYGK